MATGTAWYNLTKPASNENYSVGVWNTNLDMIDAQMHQNETDVFGGATELADGTVGNVPAPTIADKDKYLKGDGTWDTPSGGGGSSTLDGLTDVSISSPTDGQGLVYDATNQVWINGNVSGGGGSSEVSYSTTEHKIGTWIDGSDVYEQTIVLRENGTNNYTYSNSVFSQCLPANIGWIDVVSFYSKRNTGGYVDCMNISSETNMVPNPSNQSIYYQSSHNASDVIVTIRYTKTGGNS